ncbi:MAG: pyridoxal phosphate-dependent aminotransferase [Acidobacteriota bacterium]
MISSRIPRDLTENATTRTLRAMRQRGVEIVDLTASNPTTAGLAYPADLLAGLTVAGARVYDPQPLGLHSAREAVADDFRRRGVAVDPDHVTLAASTSEAYALLFKLLCDAGDAVLVPRPSYPLFDHLARLESIESRPYRLDDHGAWRIDFDHLRSQITNRVRAILVVSPNNPTGSYLHRDDLAVLASLSAAHDLMLVGDEVFADYPLDAAPGAAPVLAAGEGVVCSLGGLSKSAGLPQLKLGWMAFGGASARVSPLMGALEVIADTYLSVSTPVQMALTALMAHGAMVRQEIRARLLRNLAALRDAAGQVPAVSVLPVEGGWSAVVQVPAFRGEEELVLELLEEDRVLVHPGYFFDFEREAYLVLSLLVEPRLFDLGVGRVLARATRENIRA